MTNTQRTRLLALTVAATVLMVAGCAGAPPTPDTSPVPGGTLTIAEPADTTEMDPQVSFFDSSWRLQDLVYDSLVTTDADSTILPSIAESWTEEGNVYTFVLREGVTFSNGRALTVDDVVGSLQRLIDPATGSYFAGQLGPIEKITAIDDRTVRIELTTPWAPLLPALAATSAAILPMQELNEGSFDPTTQMLGTGPFQLDDHVQDQSWSFSAAPTYWDASDVALGGIEVRIVVDDSARVAALRDGSADIASFANPDAPALLAGIPEVESTTQESSDMYWLLLNSESPESPFSDEAQRLALATAIDRDELIATALGGQGAPTTVTPAGLEGSCSIDGLATYSGNADEASSLLSANGAEAAEVELISPPGSSVYSPMAQVLQQQMEDAGFDVTIDKAEMGSYIDRVYVQKPAQFDAVIDYFGGFTYPTMAGQYLDVGQSLGGSTLTGVVEAIPGYHEALTIANTSADEAERKAAVQTMCDLVAASGKVVPLATKATTIGVRTDRVDADIPAFDGYDLYYRNVTDYVRLG